MNEEEFCERYLNLARSDDDIRAHSHFPLRVRAQSASISCSNDTMTVGDPETPGGGEEAKEPMSLPSSIE